jgi:hypothetical protein
MVSDTLSAAALSIELAGWPRLPDAGSSRAAAALSLGFQLRCVKGGSRIGFILGEVGNFEESLFPGQTKSSSGSSLMMRFHYLGHLRVQRIEPMERLRIINMATITATMGNASISHAVNPPAARGAVAAAQPWRPRRITPEAGRAIEMLGHAIEYLADEFALECRSREDQVAVGKHPRIVAIEVMMTRNREIYFSCPTVPTFGERLRSLLHMQRA